MSEESGRKKVKKLIVQKRRKKGIKRVGDEYMKEIIPF
jgi:hypothetical protein